MLPGQRPPAIHVFKTWPEPFEAVEAGLKTHEVRKDDRATRPAAGDIVVLRCWDPVLQTYSGHQLTRRVTYVTPPASFGLPEDMYVMSLRDEALV